MKNKNFILVMPAIIHKASSGIPGKTNSSGSKNLDFLSIRFCVFSNSSLLISFDAIFSPNLSPIKNNRVFASSVAAMQVAKAVSGGNKIKDKTIRDSLRNGIKHRSVNSVVDMEINIRIAKLLELLMISLRLLMSVIPNAFKIKYATVEITAKNKITNNIFSHLFILYSMLD